VAERLRAAVIGAGKIGRHHAKWYDRCGCELAGWSVSSAAHLEARAADLRAEVAEIGQGFDSYVALLDDLAPDLVSVCTPAEHHFEAAKAALSRGIHVLCEKPLVWSDEPSRAAAEASELVALAARQGVVLAVNLQYSYAAQAYREWCGAGPASRCEVVLESRGKGAERRPDEVWMELGPHALSLVLALLPEHRPALDSVAVETSPRTALARFELAGASGTVAATVRCGQRLEGELERRFGLDHRLVDYAGRNNAAGEYSCYLSRGAESREYPDLMRTSLERFVTAVATGSTAGLVDGVAGTSNLAVQLQVGKSIQRALGR